jgi:hypothetical protein
MQKELIVVKGKVIEQQRSYTPEVGRYTTYEAGAKMVKRHFDQNPDDAMAHFMGKEIIEKILAQPGCVGIRTFHGLNEFGVSQVILVGVDQNGKNILNYQIQDQKYTGIVADGAKICPPYCGGGEETISINWW